MPPSAQRVASRFIAADPPVTEDYYKKLVELAQREELLDALPRLQRSKRTILDPDQPMRVSELWGYLNGFDVEPAEIESLKKVPLPKTPRAPKGMDYGEFSRAVGKSVVLGGVSTDDLSRYALHLKAWAKAIETLPRAAADLYRSEVKKIRLAEPRGTEDASWDAGGVLKLSLKAGTPDPKVYQFHLVHELGHALEDKSGPIATAWESPYGKPPFVTDYAEVNASEDFAETFRAFVMEPAHLKRVAPSKYEDMASHV